MRSFVPCLSDDPLALRDPYLPSGGARQRPGSLAPQRRNGYGGETCTKELDRTA
jgi:hypothetical protein